MSEPAAAGRRDELAANLAALREHIAAACRQAGRDPEDVTLVAVTKTFPAGDIAHLAALGVRDIGENREREATAKYEATAGLGLRWHFVGQLQTNKAARVARYADVVHSVDRGELADRLARAAAAAGRTVDIFIQVSLDAAPGRGGAPPDAVLPLARRVAGAASLRLSGVMAVAPAGAPAGPAFWRLAEASAELRAEFPDARYISAGMSGDYPAALAAGATHIRIGSALLGRRTAQVG